MSRPSSLLLLLFGAAAVFLAVSFGFARPATVEAWEGNDGYAAYEVVPAPHVKAEHDGLYATVMRISCDGFNQRGTRYLAGFGVSVDPYFGDPVVGLPITLEIDGQRFRSSAVRDMWDREGAVYAIHIWSYEPLWEALQAGRSATIYFGGKKVRSIGLKGTRRLLSGISEC